MKIYEKKEYTNWAGCKKLLLRLMNQTFMDIIKGGETAFEAVKWLYTRQAKAYLQVLDQPASPAEISDAVRRAICGNVRRAVVELTDEERAEILEYVAYMETGI